MDFFSALVKDINRDINRAAHSLDDLFAPTPAPRATSVTRRDEPVPREPPSMISRVTVSVVGGAAIGLIGSAMLVGAGVHAAVGALQDALLPTDTSAPPAPRRVPSHQSEDARNRALGSNRPPDGAGFGQSVSPGFGSVGHGQSISGSRSAFDFGRDVTESGQTGFDGDDSAAPDHFGFESAGFNFDKKYVSFEDFGRSASGLGTGLFGSGFDTSVRDEEDVGGETPGEGGSAAAGLCSTPQKNYGGDNKASKQTSARLEESDTYSQKSSPTLGRFLKKKEAIIAQKVVCLFARDDRDPGVDPIRETDIRVAAKPSIHTSAGDGLHEVVPTNMHKTIASWDDSERRQAIAEIQSGLRTSPALTPMHDGKGTIGGHTGTFTSKTYTVGQKHAHDILRQALLNCDVSSIDAYTMLNIMSNAQLDVIPHGQLLLASVHISGAQANLAAIADALENTSTPPGQNRFDFACIIHERRECMKLRGRTWKRAILSERARSPSPERSPLRRDGKGGEPIYSTSRLTPLPPLPKVDDDFMLAHWAAWISEPMRLDESENILPARRA
jgi:hypothetical protein